MGFVDTVLSIAEVDLPAEAMVDDEAMVVVSGEAVLWSHE